MREDFIKDMLIKARARLNNTTSQVRVSSSIADPNDKIRAENTLLHLVDQLKEVTEASPPIDDA